MDSISFLSDSAGGTAVARPKRQLLRLQNLGDGGVLGFMVELFFLAFEQLLSTCNSSSKESHSALYMFISDHYI